MVVPRVKHHAALVEPARVGELLRAIDEYEGRFDTQYALQLAPHVFCAVARRAHEDEATACSALSRQSLYLLKELRSLARPGDFLFPALHTTLRPICDNTLNVSLRRLGYQRDEMTSHGFRAMASTLLNELASGIPIQSSVRWRTAIITRSGPHTTGAHIGRSALGWRNGGSTTLIN